MPLLGGVCVGDGGPLGNAVEAALAVNRHLVAMTLPSDVLTLGSITDQQFNPFTWPIFTTPHHVNPTLQGPRRGSDMSSGCVAARRSGMKCCKQASVVPADMGTLVGIYVCIFPHAADLGTSKAGVREEASMATGRSDPVSHPTSPSGRAKSRCYWIRRICSIRQTHWLKKRVVQIWKMRGIS